MPRNAARPLRYMDRYVLVKQGEVFYMTEALAVLEGLERGPAGNTSLTAAFSIAQEMNREEIIVVQETEYTGAGKHPLPQLTFAKENGIEIKFGSPEDEKPGTNIILPEHPSQIKARNFDLTKAKISYIKNCIGDKELSAINQSDIQFIAEDLKLSSEKVKEIINEIKN